MEKLWPFGVYAAAVVLVIAVMVGLSAVLGERHHEPQTDAPYEGGVVSVGKLRGRVASEFYLVAAFFVVFDVETVFLFAWAVAGRSLGWAAFVELAIFIGLLLAALVYLWRSGALELQRRAWLLTRRHSDFGREVPHDPHA